jgi:hypothetical protein
VGRLAALLGNGEIISSDPVLHPDACKISVFRRPWRDDTLGRPIKVTLRSARRWRDRFRWSRFDGRWLGGSGGEAVGWRTGVRGPLAERLPVGVDVAAGARKLPANSLPGVINEFG